MVSSTRSTSFWAVFGIKKISLADNLAWFFGLKSIKNKTNSNLTELKYIQDLCCVVVTLPLPLFENIFKNFSIICTIFMTLLFLDQSFARSVKRPCPFSEHSISLNEQNSVLYGMVWLGMVQFKLRIRVINGTSMEIFQNYQTKGKWHRMRK